MGVFWVTNLLLTINKTPKNVGSSGDKFVFFDLQKKSETWGIFGQQFVVVVFDQIFY